MNPTAAQLRQMKRDNLRYPDALEPIPREQWPVTPFVEAAERFALWRSRKFLVQGFREVTGMVRLSVNRTEWDERKKRFRGDIAWDDLQRLKGEAGYPDAAAVEVFPPDDRVVNVANMRHLWILPDVPAWIWGGARNVR